VINFCQCFSLADSQSTGRWHVEDAISTLRGGRMARVSPSSAAAQPCPCLLLHRPFPSRPFPCHRPALICRSRPRPLPAGAHSYRLQPIAQSMNFSLVPAGEPQHALQVLSLYDRVISIRNPAIPYDPIRYQFSRFQDGSMGESPSSSFHLSQSILKCFFSKALSSSMRGQ
jgi:hypothetical protein